MSLLGKAMLFLAETTATLEDPSTWIDSILAPLQQYLTVTNLLIFIGAALSFGVVFFLFWWGYGFIKRQVAKGVKKGKI